MLWITLLAAAALLIFVAHLIIKDYDSYESEKILRDQVEDFWDNETSHTENHFH